MRTIKSENRRVIVGFDLRRNNAGNLNIGVHEALKLDDVSNDMFPASIDTDVWPSLMDERNGGETQFGHTNVLNLLGLPDFWGANTVLTEIAAPAAFDLTTDFLSEIGRVDHVTQLELSSLQSLLGWRFLGFDIADKYVSYSALWSPHLRHEHFGNSIRERFGPMSRSGLFLDFELAVAASREASAVQGLADHAPFAPCGIWMKCT